MWKPWAELKHHLDVGDLFGPEVQLNRLQTQCFKAAWMTTVLHEGIGIPRIVDHKGAGDGTDHADEAQGKGEQKNLFQSVNDIDGFSVSWTLGKAVLEASRDIPPAPGSLPSPFDELNKANSKLGKWDPFRPKWPTTGEGSAFPPALGEASRHVSPVYMISMVAVFLLLLLTCICTRGRGPRATRRRAAIKEMLPPPLGTFGGLCSSKRTGRGDYVLANMEEAAGDAQKRGFWSKLGKRADGKDYSPTMEAEFGFNSEGSSEESSGSSGSAGRGARGSARKHGNTGIVGALGWPVRRVALTLSSTFPSLFARRNTRTKKRSSMLPSSRDEGARISARRGATTPTMVRISRPASPTFTASRRVRRSRGRHRALRVAHLRRCLDTDSRRRPSRRGRASTLPVALAAAVRRAHSRPPDLARRWESAMDGPDCLLRRSAARTRSRTWRRSNRVCSSHPPVRHPGKARPLPT